MNSRNLPRLSTLIALLVLLGSTPDAAHAVARFKTTRGVYKFPEEVDRRVLSTEPTELWAEIDRPTRRRAKPFPLVLFLHGNHGTCGRLAADGIREDFDSTYTFEGRCRRFDPIVVPNHEGYRYVAGPLAARGVVVVSINANRGITANSGGRDDFGLNLARGRLILKHIEQLARWNSGEEETPAELGKSLKGQIDFTNVGLMGHSRGGEGVRAALELYLERGSQWPADIGTPVNIKGLYEIAPVDGQTSRELNVKGVASVIILPSCDADVFDLAGMKVFDRVFLSQDDEIERLKATFLVVGANHNSFNTEWQTSDAFECQGASPIFRERGSSTKQQRVIRNTLVPFFVTVLFNQTQGSRVFDPAFPIPPVLSDLTFYERGHLRAPPASANGVSVIQTFSGPSLKSDAGFNNIAEGLTVTHRANALREHFRGLRTADLSWSEPGKHSYTINLNGRAGLDLSAIRAISFRVALGCPGVCNDLIDSKRDVDIRVTLLDQRLRESVQVRFSEFVTIRRPTASGFTSPHDVLQTVDLPVNTFNRGSGFEVGNVRQIRFDIVDIAGVDRGRVFLGQITTDETWYRGLSFASQRRAVVDDSEAEPMVDMAGRGSLIHEIAVRSAVISEMEAVKSGGVVSLMLTSADRFPITDSMPKILIGSFSSSAGMVIPGGQLKFTIEESDFEKLEAGSPVSVKIGLNSWSLESMPEPASLLS